MEIGKYIEQKDGYNAFVPNKFPSGNGFSFSGELVLKHSGAIRLLGKLDGISQLLPDVDFFLFMYIRKDAASSSQIEGTRATMIDAIEAEAGTSESLPADVDDILHYIQALNYGLERLADFPLSLRFIRELHRELMDTARTSHYSDPGNFRKSQNWIGGSSPSNASFIPPPPSEMHRALDDFEKFLHRCDDILPLFKAGLIHAQFETIHPFLDGNGRTGRLLITFYLWLSKLLEKPVLFLSSYFRKNQQIYYSKLDGYHSGNVEGWLEFFLDGVIETAEHAISTSREITDLRHRDMEKIQSLNRKASKSSMPVLRKLFALPIVNVNTVKDWTGFTRQGAQGVIDRFVDLGILEQKDKNKKYGRSFIYRRYVEIFLT
ncbi:MAG: Fic family protein [Candidatus Latescibacteria bacterium]|nr:Fic family protein [Candidatus Latescibacterota bacterium]